MHTWGIRQLHGSVWILSFENNQILTKKTWTRLWTYTFFSLTHSFVSKRWTSHKRSRAFVLFFHERKNWQATNFFSFPILLLTPLWNCVLSHWGFKLTSRASSEYTSSRYDQDLDLGHLGLTGLTGPRLGLLSQPKIWHVLETTRITNLKNSFFSELACQRPQLTYNIRRAHPNWIF